MREGEREGERFALFEQRLLLSRVRQFRACSRCRLQRVC